MMSRAITGLLLAAALVLGGCAAVPLPGPSDSRRSDPADAELRAAAEAAALQFIAVAERVEPVAEEACRTRAPKLNCDYLIVVDDRLGQPPNAYQTRDDSGRPIIAFTLGLIADARNPDELAFIMGHEAAHHILGHIDLTLQSADLGARILSGIVAVSGGTAQDVRTARDVGAAVGARTFSKEFELEADKLGTIIAAQAGYDPVLGAAYFDRIPDPGDRFLGSHPPNAERAEIVRETAAEL